MARLGRLGFLAIAVVFHLIYIYSIFDIYFVSPIVHGMKSFPIPHPEGPPAQRLVLFVGDGLRADKAFQSFPDPSPEDPNAPEALEPRPLAPFLRSCVLERGTFGVSHTRVPTESRPGHVALIAGLYEDVSAVTKGWKLNPVEFDSVFNRSRHTWSWGSPDILPMFKEGAVKGRIDADTYSEDDEDYTKAGSVLDTWVFEKVKTMFSAASKNSTLDAALRKDKNVFFLHLLGLDTTGHSYRPYSREYLDNIKVVDQGVKEITKLIEDFYGDGKTAFVFTADHGMSDWGSHGDGHPDNTRTPLVVWGSGVAKPVISKASTAPGHEDRFSVDWGLDKVSRHDVAQADIAALMAYLAGLDFPVNSVGELPLPYLAAKPAAKAEAALVNAQGVLEMYRVKENQKRSTEIRYKPFPPLGDDQHSVEYRIGKIREVIAQGKQETAIQMSQDLLQVGLQGLRYLQTYDWVFLRTLVSLGYLGWMAFAFTTVVDLHVLHGATEASRTVYISGAFGGLAAVLFTSLWIRSAPLTYYAYTVFPLVFWEEVIARREAVYVGCRQLFKDIGSPRDYLLFTFNTLAYIGLLEAMVFSYHHRSILTACFVLASFWPRLYGLEFVTNNKVLIATWVAACSSMSIFTLLPVVKTESITLVVLGGLLMVSVGVLYLLFETSMLASSANGGRQQKGCSRLSRSLLGFQIGLIVLAMIVTSSSIRSLQAKQGLPVGNQVVGWLVLVASLSIPFLYSFSTDTDYLHRLIIIFLTFSPVFVILTISYEGLFYFSFFATLITWVRLEHHIYTFTQARVTNPSSPLPTPKPLRTAVSDISHQLSSSLTNGSTPSQDLSSSPAPSATLQVAYRPLTLADLRPSLFFLFLIQSAFFSTGNIASVSSFSLDSVYRLIPIFSPFSQGALLILKILIPFALISANLGILNKRLGNLEPGALFMCVMAISDILTLNFFWNVRDEGSWLEIGESISHFAICSLLGVFVAGLEGLSGIFIAGVDIDGEEKQDRAARVDAIANGKGITQPRLEEKGD